MCLSVCESNIGVNEKVFWQESVQEFPTRHYVKSGHTEWYDVSEHYLI